MPLNIPNPDLRQQYNACLNGIDALPPQSAKFIRIKDEKIEVQQDPLLGLCHYRKVGNAKPNVLSYDIDIFTGKTFDALAPDNWLQSVSAGLIKNLPVIIKSGHAGCGPKTEYGIRGGVICNQYITAALNQTCSALVPAVPDPKNPPVGYECKCRDFFGNERTGVDCAECNGPRPGKPCPRPINEPDLEKVAKGLHGPQFLSYVNNLMDNANAEYCGSASREVRFQPKRIRVRGVGVVNKTCVVNGKLVTKSVPVDTQDKTFTVLEDFGDEIKCILTLKSIDYRYWPSTGTNCVFEDPDNGNCVVRRAKGADEQNSSAQFEMKCPNFHFDRCWGWEFFTYRTFGTSDDQDLRWDTRSTISQQDLFGNATDVTLNQLNCLGNINAVTERIDYNCINSPCAGTDEVDVFVAQNAKTLFSKYQELLTKAHKKLMKDIDSFIDDFKQQLDDAATNIPDPVPNCVCAVNYSGVSVTTNYAN